MKYYLLANEHIIALSRKHSDIEQLFALLKRCGTFVELQIVDEDDKILKQYIKEI